MKQNIIILFAVSLLVMFLLTGCSADVKKTRQIEVSTVNSTENTVTAKDYSSSVRFSEIMAKNTAAYNVNGNYSNFIELYNNSDEINLDGWSISNGEEIYTLPNGMKLSNGYNLFLIQKDKEDSIDIDISDDTLILLDNLGRIVCKAEDLDMDADESLCIDENGNRFLTYYITPGLENTAEGYEKYCDSILAPNGPIVINEVSNTNTSYVKLSNGDTTDWIEIKNISDDDVELGSFYISNKNSNKKKFTLPNCVLKSGEMVIIHCDDDNELESKELIVPFSISPDTEGIWISNSSGTVIDSIRVHDIPINGSCGRIDGKPGFFYFEKPTPNEENSNGFRRVLKSPVSSLESNAYDNVDSLIIELSCGEGTIYYTTDSTIPTAESTKYEKPIEIRENTIIRAIAVSDTACCSRVNTLSYIVNQNQSLPVVSLVTDDYDDFKLEYNSMNKSTEVTANMSLYMDGKEVFSNNCGIKLKGWTSLKLPKKSMGIYFRGKYGDGKVKCDLFNSGVTEYSSLVLRAGQDYMYAVIRNELMQDICVEESKECLTQHGQYCVVYLNGEYFGLYCLKENDNEKYFSSLTGADPSTVTISKGQIYSESAFGRELDFVIKNNMADEENYEKAC